MAVRRLLLALLALWPAVAYAQIPTAATATANLTSTTCTGSPGSGTGCLSLNTTGMASATIQLQGTWTATVTFRGSVDGVTFSTINAIPINNTTPVTTASGNGIWSLSVAGLKYFQAAVTAYTSGTVVVNLQTALAGGGTGIGGGGGSAPSGTIGSAVPSTASPVAVKDNLGNLAFPTVDSSARLIVNCGTGCSAASDTVGGTVALNALNTNASVALTGTSGAGFLLVSGTLIGTIVPELSYDGGSTWTQTDFFDPNANTFQSSIVFASNNPNVSQTIVLGGGASNARVRVSAYTSGTANATLRATQNAGGLAVLQGAGPWAVNGTVTAQQATAANLNATVTYGAGTFATSDTHLPAAAALSDTLANPTTSSLGSNTLGWDATNSVWRRVQVTPGTGHLLADISTAGALSVQGTLTNNTAAPSTNNIGALGFTAVSTAPSLTAGNLVTGYVDLFGTHHVGIYDTAGNALIPSVDYVHNTALTVATTAGPMTICRASAASPTNVSADNNAVMQWCLPSGSGVFNPAYNGSLAATGTGASNAATPRVAVSNDSLFSVNANYGSGTFVVGQASGANLHVDCDSGCSSSPAPGDESTYSPGGASTVSPVGGFFQTTPTNNALTNLQLGAFQVTAQRALFTNLRNASGTEIATTTTPAFVGSVFNTTAPAPSNGAGVPVQADQAGNLRTVPGIATATLTGWTSATALNTTQNIFTNSGVGEVMVLLQQTTTITGGAITFEVTFDGANWVTIPADAVVDPTSTTYAQISLPYTLVASTNKAFLLTGKGWQGLRIKLSTAITGTATVTPVYTLIPYETLGTVVALSPTAANFNVTTTPPANASSNVAQFGGTNVVTGTGAGGAGIPRVTISNDSSLAANQSVNNNQWNGQAVASPDANSYVVNANAATATANAAASPCNVLSAASNNATNCKGSAGNFYGYEIYNTTTTVYYLRLYNTSTSPTCSSATGFIRSIPIPPAAASGQVGGAVSNQTVGVNYSTGISYCLTGGSSSTDNTNAAVGVFGEIRYK